MVGMLAAMPSAPSNRPDRDETPVRDRGDACPGALRLHTADDGALARVRVPAGVLTARQAYALADAAERLGDGALDITSRGNLQLRGLDGGCGGELAALLDAAGLLPAPAHERVRNIVASPLSGLDDRGHLDVQPLVRELDALLCASERATALSGRFLFALDDGRGDMAGLGADVMLLAEPGGARVRILLGEQAVTVRAADGARALLLAAEAFLAAADASATRAWRVRELPPEYAVSAAELARRLGDAGVAAQLFRRATAAGAVAVGSAGGVVGDAEPTVPVLAAGCSDGEPATAGAGSVEGPGQPRPARAGAPSGDSAAAVASASRGADAPEQGGGPMASDPERGGGPANPSAAQGGGSAAAGPEQDRVPPTPGPVEALGSRVPAAPDPEPSGDPTVPVPGVVRGSGVPAAPDADRGGVSTDPGPDRGGGPAAPNADREGGSVAPGREQDGGPAAPNADRGGRSAAPGPEQGGGPGAPGPQRDRLPPAPRPEQGGGPLPGVVHAGRGRDSLHVGVALGRMRVAQWRVLARVAETYGTGELRVTPWRGVVLPGVSGALLPGLGDAGLVTGPDSPWVGVGACTGRPGCAKSLADVRADATARTAAGAGGLPVYWSGCERRCGHPHGAWVDVVATGDGRYDLTAPGVPRHTVPLTELADALAAARGNPTDPTERPTK